MEGAGQQVRPPGHLQEEVRGPGQGTRHRHPRRVKRCRDCFSEINTSSFLFIAFLIYVFLFRSVLFYIGELNNEPDSEANIF